MNTNNPATIATTVPQPPAAAATFLAKVKIRYAIRHIYRPQTKFAKAMFLHLSVSHSVHGGGVSRPRGRLGGLAQTLGEVGGSGQGGV